MRLDLLFLGRRLYVELGRAEDEVDDGTALPIVDSGSLEVAPAYWPDVEAGSFGFAPRSR